MKTAISLPDDLFRRIDRLARDQQLSRSAFFRRALEAYIANLKTDVTSQINSALAEIGKDPENERWVKAATAHAMRRRS